MKLLKRTQDAMTPLDSALEIGQMVVQTEQAKQGVLAAMQRRQTNAHEGDAELMGAVEKYIEAVNSQAEILTD